MPNRLPPLRRRSTPPLDAASRLAPLLLVTAACTAPRPSELAREEPFVVAVKSARLPADSPWITRFAHHAWVDVKRGDESSWWRAEVIGRGIGAVCSPIDAAEARSDVRFDRRGVRLLATLEGEPARRIADAIEAACAQLDARYAEGYLKWPGPNSNTFVADLARELPDLDVVLDGNAVGKDWPGWFAAGASTSGSGVRLDTPLLGATVGVADGVELHVLGLTAAVRLFPPALALPFLPEFPTGLATERWNAIPPPPEGRALRLDLPADAGEVAGAADAIEREFECDDGATLALVDAATGEWAQVQLQRHEPDAIYRRLTFEANATLHRERFDSQQDFAIPAELAPGEPARFGEAQWRFGRCEARLTARSLPDGRLAVRVRLSRNDAPDGE